VGWGGGLRFFNVHAGCLEGRGGSLAAGESIIFEFPGICHWQRLIFILCFPHSKTPQSNTTSTSPSRTLTVLRQKDEIPQHHRPTELAARKTRFNHNSQPGWKAVVYGGDQTTGNPADIVFIIRDKPNPLFKRENADIRYTLPDRAEEM